MTIARTVNDISGLSFLETITGNLNLDNCDQLNSLDGLQNISTIGGYLRIYHLDNLVSLEGINGQILKEIGNALTIDNCRELIDISTLEGIQHIGAELTINNNDKLVSLKGLDSLILLEGQFTITGNNNLADCSAVCMLINDGTIEGRTSVSRNTTGCNSFEEMQILCSSQEDCPLTSYTLDTQDEVNAFVATFSNCNTIAGNLTITGSTINDISRLSFLETITGNLDIHNSSNLSSLDGLQNLSLIHISSPRDRG